MEIDAQTRNKLIELATEIIDCRDRGVSDADHLSSFEDLLPGTDIDNLCNSDWPAEVIVDTCIGIAEGLPKLTEPQLVELVENLVKCRLSEAEENVALETFISNCKHPAKSDLIYFPDDHFDGNLNPSVEEIVAKALGNNDS